MPMFKKYDGTPIEIPIHTHVIHDTLNANNKLALATTTEDGFMTSVYKNNIDSMMARVIDINKRLENAEFIDTTASILIPGPEFYLLANAYKPTSITFTNTPIPADKISSAKLVSTTDSYVKSYMYSSGSTVYVSPEVENITIYANTNSSKMFYNINTLTTIVFDNFNTSKVENFSAAFYSCFNLTSLDFTNWDTSKVITFDSFLRDCYGLKTIDISMLNMSNTEISSNMFYNCNGATEIIIGNKDTRKLRTIANMFRECKSIISLDLSGMIVDSVKYMDSAFYGNTKLLDLNISTWSTPSLESAVAIFMGCSVIKVLDVSTINVSKLQSLNSFFFMCPALEQIIGLDGWDVSNIATADSTFRGCYKLKSVDIYNWNLSNLYDTGAMFLDAKVINASIIIRNPATDVANMFLNCATNGGLVNIYYTSGNYSSAYNMYSTRSSSSNVKLIGQVTV